MKLYELATAILIGIPFVLHIAYTELKEKEPQIAVTQQLGEGRSITCYVPASQVTKDTTCVGEKV